MSLLQLILFSLSGIALFFLSLVIGLLLYNIRLQNTTRSYFINSFLGVMTILCIYSFCFVGIKTVNVIAFLALVYLVIKNPSRFQSRKISIKDLLPVFYIFPLVFICFGYYTLPVSIENDVRFYAKIVHALTAFRQENIYHFYNTYDASFNGLVSYHYTELWLGSFFHNVLQVKSIIALKYVAYPFLVSGVCFGVSGFFNRNRFLLFVLFLALSAFPLYQLISFLKTGWVVYTDFWIRPNFIIYYYCLLPLFLLLAEKRWNEFTWLSVIVSTSSVVIHPCLLAGVFFVLVYLAWKKELSLKHAAGLFGILFLAYVLTYVMYMLFAPTIDLIGHTSASTIIANSLRYWKAVVFILSALILECAVFISLAWLLNKYIIKSKNLDTLFVFIMGQVVAGVALFQLLNQMDNTYQFPYIAFAATGFIVIITLMAALEKQQNKYLFYTLSILLIAISLLVNRFSFNTVDFNHSLEITNLKKNKVSDAWIANADQFFRTYPHAKGGFVYGAKDLPEINPKSRHCMTYQVGSFICYLTDNCNLPSLTCSDTVLSDKTEAKKMDFEKAEVWMKTFPRYTTHCDFKDFIKSREIDFVICKRKVVKEDSLVSVYKDDNSDYSFITKK